MAESPVNPGVGNDPAIAELEGELSEVKARILERDAAWVGKRMPAEEKEALNADAALGEEIEATIKELNDRNELVRTMYAKGAVEKTETSFQSRRPGSVTGADIYDLSSVRRTFDDPSVEGAELRSRAQKALEGAVIPHPRVDEAEAKTHVERLIGMEPEDGRFSRYLVATGSPTYKRAFTKMLSANGSQMLTRDEQAAIAQAQAAERAMSLTTTSGGFAVPFVLDPTVILSSDGAINPYRAIADVENITVDEWRGVSSAGITAAFQAEASAVTDASPTLAQPVVSTEMARAFVPFSIEIGQDWSGFATQMARMLSDSKDVLEATKFAVGSGTNEPFGVVTGASTVFTASNTNSLVVADIYGVHNALGPRFRSRATWVMNNAVADRIRQLDTAGGANIWVQNLQLASSNMTPSLTDGRMGVDLLGHPVYEASAQSGTFTTGQIIAVLGDFSKYKIIDRIGMNIELIPHIFGASQGNLPTGQRGYFAYWRVGAKVLTANAFRALKLA